MRCGFKRTSIWFEGSNEEPVVKSKTWQCSREGKHLFDDTDGDGKIMLCTQHFNIAIKSMEEK
jgi:hypothetical protein